MWATLDDKCQSSCLKQNSPLQLLVRTVFMEQHANKHFTSIISFNPHIHHIEAVSDNQKDNVQCLDLSNVHQPANCKSGDLNAGMSSVEPILLCKRMPVEKSLSECWFPGNQFKRNQASFFPLLWWVSWLECVMVCDCVWRAGKEKRKSETAG